MIKLFVCLTLLLVINFAKAADDSYGRTWLGLFQKKMVSEKVSVLGEVQLRYLNDDINLQQILVRSGFMYRLNEKNEVGAVYGYIQTGLLKEHRPTLQWTGKLGSDFSARSRLEFRKWEENTTMSVRLRPLLRYDHLLESKNALVVWNEPFINISHDSESGNRIFERNRLFLGLRIPYEQANLEFGYLNQTVPRTSVTAVEHVFLMYLFI